MDESESIFFVVAAYVGLACIVAFGLFRLIAGKGKASPAIDYGRKWSAWAVFTGTATTLQKFFRKPDVDSFAVWLLVTITLGIVAFVAGSLYGKYFKQANGKSPKMKDNQTGTDSFPSTNMPHVSEKDVQPKTTQKQDRVDLKLIDINTESSALTTAKQTFPKTELNEEAFYAQAFAELESENKKVGLWAKSFSEAQGNESLAKANYLKIRSGQLANEYKQVLLEEEHQRQEEVEKIAKEEGQRREAEKIAEMERAGKFISPTLVAKFVLIPPGTFMMGSPASEEGRDNNETQHQVTISKPFYMQMTPVTQGQWKRVMGNNPSHFPNLIVDDDDYPVERVSWYDVQEFIKKLNKMEKMDKYRLPTEAEWEYAARAGTMTRFHTGNSEEDLSRSGWYSENSGGETHPVGQKTPNGWGLDDMHGNVWEWVEDRWGDYPAVSVTDPEGPSSGSCRVARGGSWYYDERLCRSARRDENPPRSRSRDLGFRLARTC